jgi:type IV fimbrial biogenesis protein FimT
LSEEGTCCRDSQAKKNTFVLCLLDKDKDVVQGKEKHTVVMGRAQGFTLVELMMALVVIAVLITISAPGISELIKNNRMLSQVYALRAALNTARSEALTQRTAVTLCRSEDGITCSGDSWNKGYIAFMDADRNGQPDDPNDPRVVVANLIDVETLAINFSNGDANDPQSNIVSFDTQGYARDTSGTFTICDDRDYGARGLIVTPVGVVQSPDSDAVLVCP